MSFLNIKNHEERDKMIEDYLALKERLKKRSMEERGDLMDRRRDLEENFEPVVASNREMTREIVEELIPIKKGLHEFAERVEEQEKLVAGMKRDVNSQPMSSNNLSNFGPYTQSFI